MLPRVPRGVFELAFDRFECPELGFIQCLDPGDEMGFDLSFNADKAEVGYLSKVLEVTCGLPVCSIKVEDLPDGWQASVLTSLLSRFGEVVEVVAEQQQPVTEGSLLVTTLESAVVEFCDSSAARRAVIWSKETPLEYTEGDQDSRLRIMLATQRVFKRRIKLEALLLPSSLKSMLNPHSAPYYPPWLANLFDTKATVVTYEHPGAEVRSACWVFAL